MLTIKSKKFYSTIFALTTSLTLSGCSMSAIFSHDVTPNEISSSSVSGVSTVSASDTEAEAAPTPPPTDIFEEQDRAEKEAAERVAKEAEEAKRKEEEKKEAERRAAEELENSKYKALNEANTPQKLVTLLKKDHDNSSYGEPEGLGSYVGQISISNAAYCVSNIYGLETKADLNKLLGMKLIRKDFTYTPDEPDDVHEIYDKNGTLLFSIEEMDFFGGLSVGKYRVRIPGNENSIDFYSDDVNIEILEEIDKWSEAKKAEIGDRKSAEIASEEELIKQNMEEYGEPKTLAEYLEDGKVDAINNVKVYKKGHELADENGYVQIPLTCQYVQDILNRQYIKKKHRFKLVNEMGYLVFEDKDGNQLFTLNKAFDTEGIDLSQKEESIKKGYEKGKVTELYPAGIDIKKALETEENMLKTS